MWILKYLKGTTSYGIVFRSEQGDHSVVEYVDSDYSSEINDRRSITDFFFTSV